MENGNVAMRLDPTACSTVNFMACEAPILVVVVDTEAEFDWTKPV